MNRQAAHRLFGFSIIYLFVLFVALLISGGGDRWSPSPGESAVPAASGSATDEFATHSATTARGPSRVSAEEV